MHAQPPLFNALGGLVLRAKYPHELEALQSLYSVLGALLSALVFPIGYAMTGRKRLGFLCGLLVAVNPGLLLYEAHTLYMVPVAFLVVLSVAGVALQDLRPGSSWGQTLPWGTALLSMTWGLFSAVLIVPCAILVSFQSGRRRFVRCLVIGLSALLLPLSWSAKNAVQYGFFGTGSWGGMNVWRMVSAHYSAEELQALADDHVISELAAQVPPFSPVEAYQPFGYTLRAGHPVLDGPSLHNINYIAISKQYKRDALALMRHDPGHYRANVLRAYRMFCIPSAVFHVRANVDRLQPWENWVTNYVWAHKFLRGSKRWQGFNSWLFFALPLLLIFLWGRFLFTAGTRLEGWFKAIGQQGTRLAAGGLVTYVTLAGCLFEIGENDRFKFVVEALILCLLVDALCRIMRFLWKAFSSTQ